MKTIRLSPLFKIVLLLSVGIGMNSMLGNGPGLLILPGMIIMASVIRSGKKLSFHKRESLTLIGAALLLIGLGSLRQSVENYSSRLDDLEPYNCQEQAILGVVSGPIKENAWDRKATLHICALQDDSTWQPLNGKLLAYFPADGASIQQHDSILVLGRFQTVYSQYGSYLSFLHQKGIHHAIKVEAYQVRRQRTGIMALASNWQRQFSQNLGMVIKDRDLSALGQAMFLGDKSHLSTEMKADFAAAGASHVLAISGLHVGIVFIFITFLLTPLTWLRNGKKWRSFAALILLLLFMVMTGASPAVVRAVMMLGSVLVFRLFYARYQLLNVVSLAALIQVLHNPGVIKEVGFQLSYAAVLGIVFLLPYFEKQYKTKHRWLGLIYGWIAVSLVATLATAPLIIYYFGQFPTYFLLTNLLISGFLPLLMGLGFMTVLLAGVPMAGAILGGMVEFPLHILATICTEIAALPFAVIENFSLSEKGLPALLLQVGIALLFLFAPVWKIHRPRFSRKARLQPTSPSLS